MRSSGGRPGRRAPRSFRLHRPSRHESRDDLVRDDLVRGDPVRGDMVIGAFVLARLLGLRLLTLEAQVVVHDDDRAAAGSGPLVITRLAPDRPALSPARPGRPGPPGRWIGPGGPVQRDRRLRPGLASGGPGPLARAVQLVEQGADTLERTRRGQYRG